MSHLFEHESEQCGFIGVNEDGTDISFFCGLHYTFRDIRETEERNLDELSLSVLLPEIKVATCVASCLGFRETGCVACDLQNHMQCMILYFEIRMRGAVVQ